MIINVPLTVCSSQVQFTLGAQEIQMYDMQVSVTPSVQLTLASNQLSYGLGVTSNLHSLEMQNSTAIVIESSDIPRYTGDYVVVPLADNEVVLATKNKRCTDDITVTQIPTYTTHNAYGETFYIAEVADGN